MLMNNDLKEFLVIYDVRGIQTFIFRTKKLQEITGASLIVRNILNESLKKICKEENIIFIDWCNLKECYPFHFFNEDNLNKEIIEIVYEGGGNLLIATRLQDDKLLNLNQHLQLEFLKNSYSLSLAYATIEITKGANYLDLYKQIKFKLTEVKKRMPQLSLRKPLPICDVDPTTGYAYSIKKDKDYITFEADLKKNCFASNYYKNGQSLELDSLFFSEDEIKNQDSKTMIAVIHIDGNDMGGIISSFMGMQKKDHLSFEEEVSISRRLSFGINNVFKNKVEEILNKYKTRTVITSGDDITFICRASNAITITKEIMEMIENNYLGENPNNIFTSCAGIAIAHRHFPFDKAYGIAEECCSIAKARAKEEKNKYIIKLNNVEVKRPASYLDFEIIHSGIIKNIESTRSLKPNLYLRPYLVSVKHQSESIKQEFNTPVISDLIMNIKKLKDPNTSRSAVKEIRNTYEKDIVSTKLLFYRLKSRNNISNFDYIPYDENNVAKYYDATSLIDLYEEEENESEA